MLNGLSLFRIHIYNPIIHETYATGVATAAMGAIGVSVTNSVLVFGKLCLYLCLVVCTEDSQWLYSPKLNNSLFTEIFTACDGRAKRIISN